MKVSTTTVILRSLLGIIFLVFGVNGFFPFLPFPPVPGRAVAFLGALAASGYMFKLVFGTQVVSGALLLSGLMVPLALVLLAPIIVNIVAFHVFLAPGGLPLAAVVTILEIILAWQYREAFRALFR
jgi:uncharacterized membrane protein YphA (DoxX/SURF4 family)